MYLSFIGLGFRRYQVWFSEWLRRQMQYFLPITDFFLIQVSSLKVTRAVTCEIGFAPSGNSTLGIVACITNEKGSFSASLWFSFLILWCVFQLLGMEGKVLFISAMCFTKLLQHVCLGGNRKNSSLNSRPSCNLK